MRFKKKYITKQHYIQLIKNIDNINLKYCSFGDEYDEKTKIHTYFIYTLCYD